MAREFRDRGHPVAVLADPQGELWSLCREAGLELAPAAYHRRFSPGAVLDLARRLKTLRPDSVLSFNRDMRAAHVAAARLAAEGGAPARVVCYCGAPRALKNNLFNRCVLNPHVAGFVANAAAIRRNLLSFGWLTADRVRLIYDGVDPAPIQQADPTGLREELGAAPGDVVALTLARFVGYKGHAQLLEAAGGLAPADPRLKLWFAGDGPEEENLRGQVERLGLREHVLFLGRRSDVPRLLRAADVLCHPSRVEGAPNAVLEGMAAGLPVVAVAAFGTAEYVVEGETGLLSRAGDIPALRRNLEAVLEDASLRRRMGEAGRERALSRFSEGRCAEEWLAFLEERAGPGRV
jgi:glycosyltransferase involved in cell wall biosynthesis